MPAILDIDHQLKRTHAVASGPITLADVRAHLGEEGVRCGLGYRELIDATQAKAVFDSADARTIVEILRQLGQRGALGPTAVIVSDDVTYGMVRMVGLILGDICELRAFRLDERAKAEAWLKIEPVDSERP